MSWRRYSTSWRGVQPVTWRPSTTTWPLVGVSIPPRMLRAVVLPAPEAPRITASSPFSTVKLASSRARSFWLPAAYSLTMWENSM